jgi:hypothetical protein
MNQQHSTKKRLGKSANGYVTGICHGSRKLGINNLVFVKRWKHEDFNSPAIIFLFLQRLELHSIFALKTVQSIDDEEPKG